MWQCKIEEIKTQLEDGLKNLTLNYPYKSFLATPNYRRNQFFLKTPKYTFLTKILDHKTVEPAPPPVLLPIECPSPRGMNLSTCRGFLIAFISRMFLDLQEILRFLALLSQYRVCFTPPPPLPELLFMQYVILRIELHEVLIVIVLGHVEANVKT